MAKPRRDFLQTDIGQMHVRIAQPANSKNLPLLCLHMSPQSGRNFEKFMTLASVTRIVVAPDYHGYGESDAPAHITEATIGNYARSIWTAVDQLGLKEVDVLGHHTGSKVGIEMARQQPSRVNCLTLISLSGANAHNTVDPDKSFSALPLNKDGSGLRDWWSTLEKFYGSDVPLDLLLTYYTESLRSGSTFHWGFRAAYQYNSEVKENLQKLTLPITVINPGDDLADRTPEVMNFIQNGRLIDKLNWKHGFLDLHTKDAVDTVLGAIETMSTCLTDHTVDASGVPGKF